MTKKERACKKYGLLPPKIAESDTLSLGHGLCGSCATTPFTISIPAKTHSLIVLSMIDPATGCFEIVEAKISQQHPSRICFITPGWHVTWNLNLLSLTMAMGENSNVSSNKCVYKTIMALKPNQLQATTNISQANAIIEQVHKHVGCFSNHLTWKTIMKI
jgi:hypothetical protein